MLKAAVIGAGVMGSNHLRVLNNLPNVELIGLVDLDNEHASVLANHYRIPFFLTAEDLLIKNKPDFVCIAVPTTHHFSCALFFIEKGIHVLVEKPITASVEEGKSLQEIAQKNNVKVLPGHIERYNPAIRKLKEEMQNEKLGSIYRIEVTRAGPFPTRVADIGVGQDLAVHDLDVISYLLDQSPVSLFGQHQQLLHSSMEDAVVAIINYPNNIMCVINVNWTSPTKTRAIKIFGEKGMFEVDYIDQSLWFYENSYHNSARPSWEKQSITEGAITKYVINKKEPLAVELLFFMKAISNNIDLKSEIDSSLSVINTVNLINKSALNNIHLDV